MIILCSTRNNDKNLPSHTSLMFVVRGIPVLAGILSERLSFFFEDYGVLTILSIAVVNTLPLSERELSQNTYIYLISVY